MKENGEVSTKDHDHEHDHGNEDEDEEENEGGSSSDSDLLEGGASSFDGDNSQSLK